MKLIEFKNNDLQIADEIYHIKVFRDFYIKDPEKALTLFGFMYFYYNPLSDYNYITDDEEKMVEICNSLGIKDTSFIEDKQYLKVVELYKKTVITTSSKVLDNNRKRLAKLDDFLNSMELDDKNVKVFTNAISDSIKLGVEVAKAEKDIAKDIEEQSTKVRGNAELTIGDYGM